MYDDDIISYTHAKQQLYEIHQRESQSHEKISMIGAYYTWWGGAIPFAWGTPAIIPSIIVSGVVHDTLATQSHSLEIQHDQFPNALHVPSSVDYEEHYHSNTNVHTSILQEEVMATMKMNGESVTTSLITKDLPSYVTLQATYSISGRLTHATHVQCHYEDMTVIKAVHYPHIVAPKDITPEDVTLKVIKEVELISTIKNETFTIPIKESISPFNVYAMNDTYSRLSLLYSIKEPIWVTLSMITMLTEDMPSKDAPSCTHSGIWTPTYIM
jgi:hypothetical protein